MGDLMHRATVARVGMTLVLARWAVVRTQIE
jgi:hypothetical protein